MTKARFAKFLARDRYCWHCGTLDDTLVPHHRKNRGMGGSKKLDNPSNIILMCAAINVAMESDSAVAEAAQKYGWKLESWADPGQRSVFDRATGLWFILDDDFNRLHKSEGK
jgi:hypothetical protein